MRKVLFGAWVCAGSMWACGNAGSPKTEPLGDGGDAAAEASGADATSPGDDGSTEAGGCTAGETSCGASCISSGDCAHAVTPASADLATIWVNGGVFRTLNVGTATDVIGVKVSDAVVAYRAADASHLIVEIPPGVVGSADVKVTTAAGSTTTKRVFQYGTAGNGATWTKKTMATARGGFPAMATTSDDRAIVAAGYTTPLVANCTDSADLFDKMAGASTPAANTMSTKRWTATAVTLLDGRTLIAGACYTSGCPYDAGAIDLFDPATNRFSAAKGRLTASRSFLRSLRLADGRALFASDETPSLEIYDPITDSTSVAAGSTFTGPAPIIGQIARLRDGSVLVVPGRNKPNYLFDPKSSKLTPTGDALAQVPDALIAIGDGRVVAIGGQIISGSDTDPSSLTQVTSDVVSIFDPATKKFSPWTANLATSRWGSTALLSRSGEIYVLGGVTGSSKVFISCVSDADIAGLTWLASVEVLDLVAGTVKAGPALPEPNASLRSTILADGSMIAGGGTPCGSKAVSYPSVYFLQAPPVR